jgi:hypothetical protein
MAKELNVDKGEDKHAVVRRIVPGKLVYVDLLDANADTHELSPYPIKLDQVVIRKRDGSCSPYRGEPLSELGLEVGKTVTIWGADHPETLVVDCGEPTTIFRNPLSQVASRAAEYFKR